MKFVSFYTKKYKDHADRLAASLGKLGIRHEFEAIRDQGSWKGTTSVKPAFLRRKMDDLRHEPFIVWVDADATVHQNPVLFATLLKKKTDIAVYRHVSRTPYHSSEWHNFGQLWNGTIFLRASPFTTKVLDEWILEQERHPERLEQKNLATVLAQADPSKLYCLPPEYCWVERWMRPLSPKARPVIEHFMVGDHSKKSIPTPVRAAGPEVLWCGHLYDHSGYAKANREVLLRVANTIRVGLSRSGITDESTLVDDYTKRRLDVHAQTAVGDQAPLVRFYTPREEDPLDRRHKICWTMLETNPTVHPDFIHLLNENYNEVWTPTLWGIETFRKSGLRIPECVIPLGIDPLIYRGREIGETTPRPKARLLTTARAGAVESPQGFAYLTVCQPTFRKGLDVLIKAFEDAGRKDASLVIYTGAYDRLDAWGAAPWRWVKPGKAKTLIYQMTGRRTEMEMAQLYRGMDCYVTATRGEGFDLPLLEAAASGLPVIAPNHTGHEEILDKDNSILVEPDGFRPIPGAGKISEWYEGQSFAYFGKPAIEAFAKAFRALPVDPLRLARRVRDGYTWDETAAMVTRRLLEIIRKEKP